MLSKYERPPEMIEDAARKYASHLGYTFEVLQYSGDDHATQEREARERIARGGIDAVYGFSMGGFTANRLQKDYPNLKYIKVGAPGTVDDIEPPVDHPDMPEAMVSEGPPFEVRLDQQARQYRVTGIIMLRDPFSNVILGVYHFVSGGFRRGSAPLGKYEIGAFRDVDDDPLGIGPRWMVRELGRDDGEVWDPELNDKRTKIEIHGGHRMAGTQGCFGINEPGPVYEQFKSHLHYLIAWLGTVRFEVRENPEANLQRLPPMRH
jgi:hypothetical protein